MSLIFFLKPHYRIHGNTTVYWLPGGDSKKKRKKKRKIYKIQERAETVEALEVDLSDFAKNLTKEVEDRRKTKKRKKTAEAILLAILKDLL